MLVQHCKNKEFKALLESDTIEVNITFNSVSSFNNATEKVLMTSLCRRVILSYFGLPWETNLDLPDNYYFMFSKSKSFFLNKWFFVSILLIFTAFNLAFKPFRFQMRVSKAQVMSEDFESIVESDVTFNKSTLR